jgi:hypothetical protein
VTLLESVQLIKDYSIVYIFKYVIDKNSASYPNYGFTGFIIYPVETKGLHLYMHIAINQVQGTRFDLIPISFYHGL